MPKVNDKPCYTPIAEAKYAFLIDPRPQLDTSKPPAWSCQLLLPAGEPDGEAMLASVLDFFQQAHGKARPAPKGIPVRMEPDNPDVLVARFKSVQNLRRDGTPWPGPRIVDSRKQPWDGSAIGNGSKLRIAYDIFSWSNVEGPGLTLIPTAVQVVEHVPYNPDGGADGFDEVPGGATAGAADQGGADLDDEFPF